MRGLRLLSLVLFSGLALGACGSGDDVSTAEAPVDTDNVSLGEQAWALESVVFANAVLSTAADAELSFDTESGELTGFSGCNTIAGPFTATGEALAIESLDLGTEVCAEDIMDQEQYMSDVLEGNPIFRIESGDRLSIVEPGGFGLDLRPAAISEDPDQDDQPAAFDHADLVGAPARVRHRRSTEKTLPRIVPPTDGR